MPNYFRKRRRSVGPNKNQEKVIRSREEEGRAQRAGTLRSRYPGVEKLVVHLEFVSPQQHVLSQEERVFGQNDTLDLDVPCPGRCGEGTLDLESHVEKVLTERQPRSQSSGRCQHPIYMNANEECGTELRCRVEVQYAPDAE